MSKPAIFVCLMVGFAIYHCSKYLLGFPVNINHVFTAAYWSAVTLWISHLIGRPSA